MKKKGGSIVIGATLPAAIRKQLPEIGAKIAGLWGAQCFEWTVSNMYRRVTFKCVEENGSFETDVPFENLKEFM